MSVLKEPGMVKIIICYFSSSLEFFEKAEKDIINLFGTYDYITKPFDFDETEYYKTEMGSDLKMKLISIEKLFPRDVLPEVKLKCIQIEKKYISKSGSETKRWINLDPGLLSLENFVLATGKGFSHRIYLNSGVYADLTLIYDKRTGYTDLPWTYPNYKSEKIKKHLIHIRNIYKSQLVKVKDEI